MLSSNLTSGSIDEKDRGSDSTLGSQPDLNVVCLEDRSGTRQKSNGVYGEIPELPYPVSLHLCLVLQSER